METPTLPLVSPSTSEETVAIPTRPRSVVVLEGGIYFLISALPPVSQLLLSDQIITSRSIAGTILVGFVGGCVALKAFFSQSFSKK